MGTDALAIINTRRSTRKFTTDPVGAADVRDLLEAAMNAPSAVNEQAWQFVVLSGRALEDYLKVNANTPGRPGGDPGLPGPRGREGKGRGSRP